MRHNRRLIQVQGELGGCRCGSLKIQGTPRLSEYQRTCRALDADLKSHRGDEICGLTLRPITSLDEHTQFLFRCDAGAEEVNDLGESFEVVTSPTDLSNAREALKIAGLEYESSDVSFLPTVSVSVDVETAKLVFELIDAIEDLEDVQNVYGNFDVSDEVMASLA